MHRFVGTRAARAALLILSLIASGARAQVTPSSTLICGKDSMYKLYPNQAQPNYGNPDIIQGTNGPVCWDWSQAGASQCQGDCIGLVPREAAVQNVEIRGWVADVVGKFSGDEDYTFDVILDIGWNAAGSVGLTGAPTFPINTIDRISQYIPPENIINFGNFVDPVPDCDPACGPGCTSCPAGRNLPPGTTQRTFWGGAAVAMVHVEIGAWGPGPGRGGPNSNCDIPSGWAANPYMSDPNTPVGSTLCPNADPTLHWPTNPALLTAGTYVRIVGTFWRDEDHNQYATAGGVIGSIQGHLKYQNAHAEANDCFRQYYSGHYNSWREMHSADIAVPWSRDTTQPFHTLVTYVACLEGGNGNQAMNDTQDLTATHYGVGGSPGPGYQIASITPAITGDTGTLVIGTPTAVGVGTTSTTVQMTVGAFNNGGGVMAYYDIVWGQNVPLGTCNATSCSDGCCLNNLCYAGTAKTACGGPAGGGAPGAKCISCPGSCCGGACGAKVCQ